MKYKTKEEAEKVLKEINENFNEMFCPAYGTHTMCSNCHSYVKGYVYKHYDENENENDTGKYSICLPKCTSALVTGHIDSWIEWRRA